MFGEDMEKNRDAGTVIDTQSRGAVARDPGLAQDRTDIRRRSRRVHVRQKRDRRPCGIKRWRDAEDVPGLPAGNRTCSVLHDPDGKAGQFLADEPDDGRFVQRDRVDGDRFKEEIDEWSCHR
jgi:hypothetical protein